jgi:hypothetical protein
MIEQTNTKLGSISSATSFTIFHGVSQIPSISHFSCGALYTNNFFSVSASIISLPNLATFAEFHDESPELEPGEN